MEVNGKHFLTIWFENGLVHMIDQNKLPFAFEIMVCSTWQETAEAIRNMNVRGAGAIGAAAGFAMAQAFIQASGSEREDYLPEAKKSIEATRPTARDLFYATQKVYNADSIESAIETALQLAGENLHEGKRIGEVGKELIKDGMGILTHCNAGWLAFVDYGSALAPIYEAKRKGINFSVFVDETRPRNQGARLTAWELGNENITHYIIADNASGHFIQQGNIQLVIVGTDRVAANGDVANKIGTLEKAILAKTFGIPFYVAAPLSTFDMNCQTGKDIPIEMRDPDELLYMSGMNLEGRLEEIRVAAPGSSALNPAFDVTPAAYITGFITSKGTIKPNAESISRLFK
ncbi:MAG: S-methyl-5-thioribose-1-phosphate isomerase [Bacteroidales bacterium]|nr:S-methyl-5-thioribose-1-phosphate isomerase [Bacteroidales bacterium]